MARRQTYAYQYTYPTSRLAVDHPIDVDVYMTGPGGRTVVQVQRNGSETMATWRARSVQETLWWRADRRALASIDKATVTQKRYLEGSRVCVVGSSELQWVKGG